MRSDGIWNWHRRRRDAGESTLATCGSDGLFTRKWINLTTAVIGIGCCFHIGICGKLPCRSHRKSTKKKRIFCQGTRLACRLYCFPCKPTDSIHMKTDKFVRIQLMKRAHTRATRASWIWHEMREWRDVYVVANCLRSDWSYWFSATCGCLDSFSIQTHILFIFHSSFMPRFIHSSTRCSTYTRSVAAPATAGASAIRYARRWSRKLRMIWISTKITSADAFKCGVIWPNISVSGTSKTIFRLNGKLLNRKCG